MGGAHRAQPPGFVVAIEIHRDRQDFAAAEAEVVERAVVQTTQREIGGAPITAAPPGIEEASRHGGRAMPGRGDEFPGAAGAMRPGGGFELGRQQRRGGVRLAPDGGKQDRRQPRGALCGYAAEAFVGDNGHPWPGRFA